MNTEAIPELLAPAGNLRAAKAAFDNGADAVYAGLQRFNARERGANFTHDEMARLIDLAAKRGRKVYITFNTLLKEDELPEAARMLAEIALLQPDAVIVQDLGVIKMLRDHLPPVPLHASTQMGTHNSAGVDLLADLGVERVILERQLTLDEVREITEKSPIETEIFIHGALCCSLSGMCLLSSWMGGWSGNRGKCKQPCRRRYHGADGNGFFLSTKDLYTLDLIDEICKTGVASLKIEGRLKSAQHIGDAVKAYRIMLDAPPEDRLEQLGEARRILSGAIGRKWSHGFYDEPVGSDVIQHDSLGAAGRLVGKVAGVAARGFIVECIQPIRRNDRLRIQPSSGEEGPGLVVRGMQRNGRPQVRLESGQRGFIVFDGEIPSAGLVFKTGYKTGDDTTVSTDSLDQAPLARVDLDIVLDSRGIAVRVSTPLVEKNWRRDFTVEAARQRPLTPEDLTAEFSKALPPGLGLHEATAAVKGDLFAPFKEIREVRREFWCWAERELSGLVNDPAANAVLENLWTACQTAVPPPTNLDTRLTTVVEGESRQEIADIGLTVIARPIDEVDTSADEAILPDFCPEYELETLQGQIAKVYASGCRRYRITSLYALQLLKPYTGLDVTASFPLPVSNSMAAKLLFDLGIEKVMAWVELDRKGIEKLAAQIPGRLEIMGHGHPPLLVTRAEIPVEGLVTDARGADFIIMKSGETTCFYSAAPLEFPGYKDLHEYVDRRTLPAAPAKPASRFNYDREWQ